MLFVLPTDNCEQRSMCARFSPIFLGMLATSGFPRLVWPFPLRVSRLYEPLLQQTQRPVHGAACYAQTAGDFHRGVALQS